MSSTSEPNNEDKIKDRAHDQDKNYDELQDLINKAEESKKKKLKPDLTVWFDTLVNYKKT